MNGNGGTGTSPAYPMGSLYIGDLHPDVTEAMLYEKFSQSGPVLSIRVCRDLVTRRSLGYAYVNFQQPGDAERALDTMNFDELKGNPMRIMWSQRDPSIRKSGVGNIFIKNLDKGIDNKQLYDTFSQFGNILSCKIVKDDKLLSKGYGFVHFELEESALHAIEQVNGMLLNDRKVFVGRFKNRGDRVREIGERSKQFTNVYIKNLPDDFTETELEALLTQHGEILSCKLMTDEGGKTKCFGFASFADHDSAESCVHTLHDQEIRGKMIYAGRAQKKQERTNDLKIQYERRKQDRQQKFVGVNLYVKNLDDTVSDEALREAFEAHGSITSAKVMSEAGQSKGFGFVCFSSPEEATKAVTEMNGRIVGSKPLYVALAQRKEDRKAQLQAQYVQRAGGQHPGIRPSFAGAQPIGMRPGFVPQHLQQQYASYPMPGLNAPSYYMPLGGQNRFLGPAGGIPMPRYGAPGSPRPGFPMPQGMRPLQQMNSSRVMPNMPRPGLPNQLGYQIPNPQRMQLMQHALRSAQPGFPMQNVGQPNTQNFKYTQNARNAPGQIQLPMDQQVPMQQTQQQVQQPVIQGHGQVEGGDQKPTELTAAMLAQAAPSEQKQMLGERIYPLVQEELGQEQAGKVTGMLLEIENADLLSMLEDRELLTEKVNEAMGVLAQHTTPKPDEGVVA